MQHSNDEFLGLTEIAKVEAYRAMGSDRVGIYSVEDIAQEMLVKYCMKSVEEKIQHPKAFLRVLAFQCYTAALRREKIRRTNGLQDTELIADQCIIVQQWEGREIAREELVRLDGANDIQKGIISHALIGFDITESDDRRVVAACIGIDANRLAVELHRMKKLHKGSVLTTVLPACGCWIVRLGYPGIGKTSFILECIEQRSQEIVVETSRRLPLME